MKKYALVALFAVAVFGMAFAANTTKSGSVGISGTVAEVFTLTVPAAYDGTITNGDVAETWAIGDVVVSSNVKNWTISLSSLNNGQLMNGTETIAYTVTLGSLVSDKSLSSAWTSSAQPRTPKAGSAYALSVKFGPSADYYQAGVYSDTITVTISHS